jgi:Family of unknown function (DUF6516)
MPGIEDIKRIAEIEFSDIVATISHSDYKLRIILVNDGFVDVHLSQRLQDRFGFHWECMDESKTMYRYDNVPDNNWRTVETFPCHFHNGSQDSVEASPFPLTPLEGFRAFMEFVRHKSRG